MITKIGKVEVTNEKVEIFNFIFDCSGLLLTWADCEQAAIKWAIERLQNKLVFAQLGLKDEGYSSSLVKGQVGGD